MVGGIHSEQLAQHTSEASAARPASKSLQVSGAQGAARARDFQNSIRGEAVLELRQPNKNPAKLNTSIFQLIVSVCGGPPLKMLK